MDIFEKVREGIAKQLGIEADAITKEMKLVEDLKADSLDIVEFVMDLEEEFDTQIPEEELPNLQTVGDIVAYLEKK